MRDDVIFVLESGIVSHADDSTGEFGCTMGGALSGNSLRAPPSVVDILGYSQSHSLAKLPESNQSAGCRDTVADGDKDGSVDKIDVNEANFEILQSRIIENRRMEES